MPPRKWKRLFTQSLMQLWRRAKRRGAAVERAVCPEWDQEGREEWAEADQEWAPEDLAAPAEWEQVGDRAWVDPAEVPAWEGLAGAGKKEANASSHISRRLVGCPEECQGWAACLGWAAR